MLNDGGGNDAFTAFYLAAGFLHILWTMSAVQLVI
jgi:hypothetical protein